MEKSDTMKFVWENYDFKKHKEIDSWNRLNSMIDKYAMFGEMLSKQFKWYNDNPEDPISNYRDYVYVAKKQNQIIGFIICNVSYLENYYQAGINPIVMNPNLINSGLGKKVLIEFIDNHKLLLGVDVKDYLVMVDGENSIATKLFNRVGFKQTKSIDGYNELILETRVRNKR